MRKTNLVVLVTGASSGIGQAAAAMLAARGHRAWGTGRRVDEGPGPGGWERLRMDVDDDASVRRGVEAVLDREGRLDAVVANAGFGFGGAVEDTSPEEALAQFQTNVLGVLRLARAALPAMRARRGGCLVGVSSLGGRMGLPFQGVYAASKFALEGLLESLRMEVAAQGVRVALVEPGDVATGFTAARRLAAGAGEGSAYRDAFRRVLARVEADERGGVPAAEVARAIARVLEDPDPPLRTVVGKADQRLAGLLQPLLPGRWFQRILAAHYGL